MCFDPISATLVAAGMEASMAASVAPWVTGGIAATGAYMQAEGQQEQQRAAAKVADMNADNERVAAASESERLNARRRTALANIDARAGAAGTDMTGTAGLIAMETDKNAMLDIATSVWNRETQANAFNASADMARSNAKSIGKAMPINVATGFLTGYGAQKRGLLTGATA